MKKKTIFLLCCVILAVSLLAGASSSAVNYKVLLPNTSVYNAPSTEAEVAFVLQQNESVVLVDESITGTDGRTWQKIKYNDTYDGYVLFQYLYPVQNGSTEKTEIRKATPNKIGEKVDLHSMPSATSEVVYSVEDGTKLNVIVGEVVYNGFVKVENEGKYYFVAEENVTKGLTKNQKIACIFVGAFVGILLVVFVVLLIRKRIQRNS